MLLNLSLDSLGAFYRIEFLYSLVEVSEILSDVGQISLLYL
jgi:hypothetical protein